LPAVEERTSARQFKDDREEPGADAFASQHWLGNVTKHHLCYHYSPRAIVRSSYPSKWDFEKVTVIWIVAIVLFIWFWQRFAQPHGDSMTSLKQKIRSIEGTIEKLKKESKGKHFESITSGDLEQRLKLVSDPFITYIGSDGSTTPGGKIEVRVGISNYTISSLMSLHLWVGSGMVDPWGDKILLNVDTRFPRLTDTSGYIGQRDVKLTLQIPNTVEQTSYLFCLCLLAIGFDQKVFDRYISEFRVR
jgi:hypothetical protein